MKNSQPSQARAVLRRGQVIVNWLAVVAAVGFSIRGVLEAIDARAYDLGASNLFLGGSAFLVLCAVVAVAFIPAWNPQPQANALVSEEGKRNVRDARTGTDQVFTAARSRPGKQIVA